MSGDSRARAAQHRQETSPQSESVWDPGTGSLEDSHYNQDTYRSVNLHLVASRMFIHYKEN